MASTYENELLTRGGELAPGLELVLSDFIGAEQFSLEPAQLADPGPGNSPDSFPEHGIVVTFGGILAPPREGEFELGWFFGPQFKELAQTAAGGEEPLQSRLAELAAGMADMLATDKYQIEVKQGTLSTQPLKDFLSTKKPVPVTWLSFEMGLPDEKKEIVWTLWPNNVLDALFGPTERIEIKAEAAADAASGSEGSSEELSQDEIAALFGNVQSAPEPAKQAEPAEVSDSASQELGDELSQDEIASLFGSAQSAPEPAKQAEPAVVSDSASQELGDELSQDEIAALFGSPSEPAASSVSDSGEFDDSPFQSELMHRAGELAPGLEFVLGDFIGADNFAITPARITRTKDSSTAPRSIGSSGILVTFDGTLAAPRDDHFTFGWFLGPKYREFAQTAAGGEEPLLAKLGELAEGMTDMLATDKFRLESSKASLSSKNWDDYLSQAGRHEASWLSFDLTLPDDTKETVWTIWPTVVLNRMFGPAEPVRVVVEPEPESLGELTQEELAGLFGGASVSEPSPRAEKPVAAKAQPAPEPAPVAAPPKKNPLTSPGARRLLRTQVPVIVTLAMKNIPTSGLLDVGPGTIIEFERGCDQPLILSVNNLPIGIGEAVKIGDHFGLKVTGILPPEERAARVGGKWKFG